MAGRTGKPVSHRIFMGRLSMTQRRRALRDIKRNANALEQGEEGVFGVGSNQTQPSPLL
jgi:hypothetical protein